MALTDIIQQLLEKAQHEAENIASQTQTLKNEIKSTYEAEKKNILAEIDEKKNLDQARITRETNATISKEKRKHTLAAKSKIMKQSLEFFYNSLINLNDKDYKELMQTLVTQMNLSGSGIFHVPSKRIAVTSEFVPKGFQVQASDELKGGAMIQQGNAHIDVRFFNLVYSEFKTEIESFFAKKLDLIAS